MRARRWRRRGRASAASLARIVAATIAAAVAVAAACTLAAGAAAANTPAALASAKTPTTFAGSCQFNGPITPRPPITLVPLPGPHFDYSGAGRCDGTLDATPVTGAPLTVTFTNVATLFDTCELGPDFPLNGVAAIGPAGRRALFQITVNLARVALVGPFALTSSGNGLAVGTAQFNPADPARAPQQCATTGVSAASLSASFSTLSPLAGTREPPPASTPPAAAKPNTAPSACVAPRPIVVHLYHGPGWRVVAVSVYLDGQRIVQRRGRHLRSLRLKALAGGGHTIRIVSRLDRGARQLEWRSYLVCGHR